MQERVQELARYAGIEGKDATGLDELGEPTVPLYHSISGYVHGQWTRSNTEPHAPELNMSEYAPENPFASNMPRHIHSFLRNITGDDGSVKLKLREMDEGKEVNMIGPNVTALEVEMTLTDDVEMADYELRLPGVYFPNLGQAILTTTSDKFAGIFMLPHFAHSNSTFEAARSLLNESLTADIQRQIVRETFSTNPWSTSMAPGGPPPSPYSTPACELLLFLQQLPPVSSPRQLASPGLTFLENELRIPTGAFIPRAPEMRFSMLLFSPDCGYILESKGPPAFTPAEATHLTGPKTEALHKQSRHHLLLFALTIIAQLTLSLRQMRDSCTPSTRARISYTTIGIIALGDGFTTMSLLLVSLFVGGLWINLVGTSFLAFVSVSFFGMRFLMDVWGVQAPEREARAREEMERERAREERFQAAMAELRQRQDARRAEVIATAAAAGPPAAAGTQPVQSATLESTAPDANAAPQPTPFPAVPRVPTPPPWLLPETQTMDSTAPRPTIPLPTDTGAAPVFMPSDQEGLVDTDANALPAARPPPGQAQIPRGTHSFSALYTRFYLLLLGSLFLTLNATSWPAVMQRPFFLILALLYLSFWLPQIKRNVERNCRKALRWEYVLGQSLLRLVPMAYFFAYADNVLFAPVDLTSLAILAGWLWIHVVILGSQELIGPRWFVPKSWVTEAWDYHPLLREDEENGTLPIGSLDPSSNPTSPLLERRRSSLSIPPSIPPHEHKKPDFGDRSKRSFTCAICMNDLVVPIVPAGESGPSSADVAGLLQRRQYMVTPCRHVFHSGCLEGWMRYRLVCPVCREGVPGL